MKVLQNTLQFIGFVQILLGVIFLIFPRQFITLNGLESPPDWVFWLFAQMAARFIGYGIGMFAAAKDPSANRLWIQTMILIQAIDWLGTIYYLLKDSVTLLQASTATFLPIVFIIILIKYSDANLITKDKESSVI